MVQADNATPIETSQKIQSINQSISESINTMSTFLVSVNGCRGFNSFWPDRYDKLGFCTVWYGRFFNPFKSPKWSRSVFSSQHHYIRRKSSEICSSDHLGKSGRVFYHILWTDSWRKCRDQYGEFVSGYGGLGGCRSESALFFPFQRNHNHSLTWRCHHLQGRASVKMVVLTWPI